MVTTAIAFLDVQVPKAGLKYHLTMSDRTYCGVLLTYWGGTGRPRTPREVHERAAEEVLLTERCGRSGCRQEWMRIGVRTAQDTEEAGWSRARAAFTGICYMPTGEWFHPSTVLGAIESRAFLCEPWAQLWAGNPVQRTNTIAAVRRECRSLWKNGHLERKKVGNTVMYRWLED